LALENISTSTVIEIQVHKRDSARTPLLNHLPFGPATSFGCIRTTFGGKRAQGLWLREVPQGCALRRTSLFLLFFFFFLLLPFCGTVRVSSVPSLGYVPARRYDRARKTFL